MNLFSPSSFVLFLVICHLSHGEEKSFELTGASIFYPPSNCSDHAYSARNVIATRLQIFRERTVFLALPKYKSGVPFSIGSMQMSSQSPAQVKPLLEDQKCRSCDAGVDCADPQNVVDLALDHVNDVLWALDVGVVASLERPNRECPPKILGISARTAKIVYRIDLSEVTTYRSRLQHLLVERSSGNRIHLYVSDAAAGAIIVHDVVADELHRILLPRGVASGCRGATQPDVLYLVRAIGKRNATSNPAASSSMIYFTYLCSDWLYAVETSDLRRAKPGPFVHRVGAKDRKIILLGSDNGSSLFFRAKGQADVYVWNSETSFEAKNWQLVARGNDTRLTTHVVPASSTRNKVLWMIESNFHDYIKDALGPNGSSVVIRRVTRL
ncbi:unnamed protein product [Trichogramma brassicae]|uniref:Uncharacterized protein n=1 Tax=Trichogramma brassicae TaxID=86971 RepID=A0A6H5J4Z6_9HYME|nr:unnamed protein product [Trichogramma brassicae]